MRLRENEDKLVNKFLSMKGRPSPFDRASVPVILALARISLRKDLGNHSKNFVFKRMIVLKNPVNHRKRALKARWMSLPLGLVISSVEHLVINLKHACESRNKCSCAECRDGPVEGGNDLSVILICGPLRACESERKLGMLSTRHFEVLFEGAL
jgi:hypothetical protein